MMRFFHAKVKRVCSTKELHGNACRLRSNESLSVGVFLVLYFIQFPCTGVKIFGLCERFWTQMYKRFKLKISKQTFFFVLMSKYLWQHLSEAQENFQKMMYPLAGWLSYQRTFEATGSATLSSCRGFEGKLNSPLVHEGFLYNFSAPAPLSPFIIMQGVCKLALTKWALAIPAPYFWYHMPQPIQPEHKSFPSTAGDVKTINDSSQHRCAQSSTECLGTLCKFLTITRRVNKEFWLMQKLLQTRENYALKLAIPGSFTS